MPSKAGTRLLRTWRSSDPKSWTADRSPLFQRSSSHRTAAIPFRSLVGHLRSREVESAREAGGRRVDAPRGPHCHRTIECASRGPQPDPGTRPGPWGLEVISGTNESDIGRAMRRRGPNRPVEDDSSPLRIHRHLVPAHGATASAPPRAAVGHGMVVREVPSGQLRDRPPSRDLTPTSWTPPADRGAGRLIARRRPPPPGQYFKLKVSSGCGPSA